MLDPESQLMEEHMFVAIARFPEVPFDREAEFRAWFAWSNGQLRGIDGLRGRRLLRAEEGSYTALEENENAGTHRGDAHHCRGRSGAGTTRRGPRR